MHKTPADQQTTKSQLFFPTGSFHMHILTDIFFLKQNGMSEIFFHVIFVSARKKRSKAKTRLKHYLIHQL